MSMSLELIREVIKVNQVIAENRTQAIIENDIIVPDVKPDISRVLLLDGEAYVNNTEITTDKMHISGTICMKILYSSDDADQCIKSINTNVAFSESMEMPNIKAGMKCKVKCEIEHMDYDILNGRKINIKTILKFNMKVMLETEQGIVSNVKEVEDVQVLKDNLKVNCFVGENSVENIIKETMEVPAGKPTIKEILRNDIKITGKDYKVTENKIIAKGELNISTLYICDGEEENIEFMEHEIPFTQLIDFEGVNENAMCDMEYRVMDSQFEAEEDSDGELRMMNGEIKIHIIAAGYNNKNIEVVADAYSPHVRLSVEKEPFTVEDIMAENKGQIILKDTMVMGEENPDIAEVFNVLSKPCFSEIKVLDDKVIIEGVVNNNVLYLANNTEQPVFCFGQEIPFRHGVDIKGIKPSMNCDADLDIEHCSYSMVSSNEVEIRLVINLNIKVINKTVLPLVVRVEESALETNLFESQPSITIYFTKPGDSLWKIAKSYYTTIDDIQNINNLAAHSVLNPGQQVIIPKRSK